MDRAAEEKFYLGIPDLQDPLLPRIRGMAPTFWVNLPVVLQLRRYPSAPLYQRALMLGPRALTLFLNVLQGRRQLSYQLEALGRQMRRPSSEHHSQCPRPRMVRITHPLPLVVDPKEFWEMGLLQKRP